MSKTFDRHSQLYLRCVTLLPSTLQFEQSVKGKKEINSTLTNVNKVLSGQQRCIDSIKQANVPLACLSFNYITGSLSHILPRGQAILRHIWALVHMCGYACAWIITCVCGSMFACGQYHFTFIEMSSSPWGTCAKAEACSHASIYRLPRIRASLRQSLPRGPAEVTHTGTKFRRGEAGWALLGTD